MTLYGKVSQAGELDLTATVTSLQEPEFNPADNTATLKLVPPVVTPPPVPPAGGGGGGGGTLPPPAVSGRAVVGGVLHATVKSGAKIQWQLCGAKSCAPIKGATKPALKLLRSYAGKSVRVVESRDGKTAASRKVKISAKR